MMRKINEQEGQTTKVVENEDHNQYLDFIVNYANN